MQVAEQTITSTEQLLGKVFVSSWGYDQTNIDFFVVTKVTPKTITLTEIGAHRLANGQLMPAVEDTLTGRTVWQYKKPHFTKSGVWVSINSVRGASLWNGSPQSDTWTYGGAGH